jgi:hypothetical protein
MASNSVPREARGSTSLGADVEASSHVPSKRPRPTLSRFECRRKKMKCDRLLPCNQCKRADRIAQCSYQNREPQMIQSSTEPQGAQTNMSFPNDHMETAKWSSANHRGIMSLNGTGTRYFGPNHKLALLNRVSSLYSFLMYVLTLLCLTTVKG